MGTITLYCLVVQKTPESIDKVASTVDVSNIGKVEIDDDYGEFRLDEISFVVSTKILARNIFVAVTTFKRQMALNYVTSEPSVSRCV